MRKSCFKGCYTVVLVAVFSVFAVTGTGVAADKNAAHKASSCDSQKAKTGAVQKMGLMEKGDAAQEAPNMTSRTDQASDSGDAAAKKKLIDLEDRPNPMESRVKTGSGKALGVETGTRGPGVGPVNPAAGKAAGVKAKARNMKTGPGGQGNDAVNAQQKAGVAK
jgi:hypothetical protein